MRHALAAAAAGLACALPGAAAACTPRTPPDPAVPAWPATMGFALGSRPASPAEIDRYLRAVADASGRVRTFVAGRSLEGRPLRYAAVGTPANVARLDRLGALMRGLRAGRYGAARARAIARSAPAFVWIGGSVHGNEPSGGDADMRLLHDLAAGRTCADLARLRRVVVFLLPVQNPDGRAAGQRVNAAGFDLNRDWFARTQPETEAKVAALERFPPTVFADQHEEGGTGFFFPPNADPVFHETPAAALHATDDVVGPALRRAFAARHLPYTNYATYDLFFQGYGDTVPTTLFGAAGMTFEKGGDSAYADKTAQHFLAADATVRAAARDRGPLLSGWARSWRQARAQGARGALQPNRVVQPGQSVRFRVPDGRVHGYVLRSDVHGADAAALAERLASVGVRVRRLAAETRVDGFRGYGEPAPAPAALPAGTYYVPMAQPAKHWVQALLGEDPYVPFPYFYDVSGWSNPLLMGLRGGLLTAPLRAPTAAVAPGAVPARPPAAPAYAFAGGSEGAIELAFALLRAGDAVRRLPDGSFTAAGPSDAIAAAAARRHVDLRPLTAAPVEGSALRLPRVAVLQDDAGESPSLWTRWLLERRYGLPAPVFTPHQIGAGGLSTVDVLVVSDGQSPAGQLTAGQLLAIQAWVRAGGTLVGARTRGLAVARAAGLTGVTAASTPASLQIPGVALRVALDPADPVAAGEEAESFVFNAGDPILVPHAAHVVARYPADARFFVSGYASGTDALRGTAAATDETAGAGRVVLFAFDPAFRGYVEGTERLLGNALLAPPPSARAAARSRLTKRRHERPNVRPIAPAALALAADEATRDATLQVAAGDERALRAAARAAGVPGFTVERDLTTVTLRVPGGAPLGADPAPWARRLPAALAAAGVVPVIAVL